MVQARVGVYQICCGYVSMSCRYLTSANIVYNETQNVNK